MRNVTQKMSQNAENTHCINCIYIQVNWIGRSFHLLAKFKLTNVYLQCYQK